MQENKQTTNNQVITSSTNSEGFHIIKNSEIKKENSHELMFQATANTMYWVWQCGGIDNYNWARIQLSDVNIEQVN